MEDKQTIKNFNKLADRMKLLLTTMDLNEHVGRMWFFGSEELDLISLCMPYPLKDYTTFEGIPWTRVDLPSALALITAKKNEG